MPTPTPIAYGIEIPSNTDTDNRYGNSHDVEMVDGSVIYAVHDNERRMGWLYQTYEIYLIL